MKRERRDKITATIQSLDISECIYNSLVGKLTNFTTYSRFDTAAAVSALPLFMINRELYSFILLLNKSTRCLISDYGTGNRCSKCFAKHIAGCKLPSYFNTQSKIPWEKRCVICYNEKSSPLHFLCGEALCMFTFIVITRMVIIKFESREVEIEWI